MIVISNSPEIRVLSEAVIRSRLTKALKHVFHIMLSRPVELCERNSQGEVSISPAASGGEMILTHFLGSVGFVGKLNGRLHLYLPDDFATACTRQLLRANEHYSKRTAETAIVDAIGEITNMTAGVFKNALTESGFTCRLSIPSVFRCRPGSMEPGFTSSRYIYHFTSSDSRLVVELVINS